MEGLMKHRIFAFPLSLILCLSLFPISALVEKAQTATPALVEVT